MDLRSFTPALPGFGALTAHSLGEGHCMQLKLTDNWAGGANRFSRPGELINAAFDGDRMVGVGGRNIDPYSCRTIPESFAFYEALGSSPCLATSWSRTG